jgi:hypothetical protein
MVERHLSGTFLKREGQGSRSELLSRSYNGMEWDTGNMSELQGMTSLCWL